MQLFTEEEVDRFFETQEKIRQRIGEVALVCTNYKIGDSIKSVTKDGPLIYIEVTSLVTNATTTDCFPAEYLTMSLGAVEIAEKARKLKEAARAREEAEMERAEREEYERLKRKFG